MIEVTKDQFGLKRGQKFNYSVDNDKVVLTHRGKKRIVRMTLEMFSRLKFKHEENNNYAM